MLMGMLYADILYPYRPNNSFPERVVLVGMARIVYIHISVGFCVARSDSVGNARALRCGTSDEHRLPRFFVYRKSHLLSPKKWEYKLGKAYGAYRDNHQEGLTILQSITKKAESGEFISTKNL